MIVCVPFFVLSVFRLSARGPLLRWRASRFWPVSRFLVCAYFVVWCDLPTLLLDCFSSVSIDAHFQ